MKIKQTETSIQRKKNKKIECAIQSKILDYLARGGICAYRTGTTGVYHGQIGGKAIMSKNKNKGWADITCLHQGKAIFLEVKTETGVLSKDQEAFANKVILAGCSYFIVRSKQDVKSCLETIGVKL